MNSAPLSQRQKPSYNRLLAASAILQATTGRRLTRRLRDKQKAPPGDWSIWLLLAGRGFGKTLAINSYADEQARAMPGSRGAIVGATAADTRDVLVEGESGLLSFYPDGGLTYEPSKRRITWEETGSVATLFSADKPDMLRGPQFHWAIADEYAAWRRPEAMDMLLLGLRLGEDPRLAVATTPRPLPQIKAWLEDPTVHVTRGSTYENRDNLADTFFDQIIKRYEGTHLGRQEIYADILDDMPGALWNRELLESTRVDSHPDLFRIVVGVDPAASTGTTGIVVVGAGYQDGDVHGYVIDDATLKAGISPGEWASQVIAAYNRHKADIIVGEVNNGGDMVEHTLRSVSQGQFINYKSIRASRGKYTRAEPIVAIYEQGRGHHVGFFGELEDQQCSWLPGDDSPDRLDAMVWAFTELDIVKGGPAGSVVSDIDISVYKTKRKSRLWS